MQISDRWRGDLAPKKIRLRDFLTSVTWGGKKLTRVG